MIPIETGTGKSFQLHAGRVRHVSPCNFNSRFFGHSLPISPPADSLRVLSREKVVNLPEISSKFTGRWLQ